MGNPDNDPMPVFVLKGKDALAPGAIGYYRRECYRHGLIEQGKQVGLAFDEMADWQDRNPEQVKLPDHSHVPVTGGADERDELIRVLFEVYRTWWYDVGGSEPPRDLIDQGVASLLSNEDHEAMQDACALVEPHEARIRELLGGDTNE